MELESEILATQVYAKYLSKLKDIKSPTAMQVREQWRLRKIRWNVVLNDTKLALRIMDDLGFVT